jgi:hypothetical protein
MLTDQDGRWQARMLNVPYDSREDWLGSTKARWMRWAGCGPGGRRQIQSGGNVTSELRKLADRIAQETDLPAPPKPAGGSAKRLELCSVKNPQAAFQRDGKKSA